MTRPPTEAALLKVHAHLRIAEPHYPACSGRLIRYDKFKHCRDSHSALDLKTRANFRKIAHRAWDRVASEKNPPGFEHPHPLCFSAFIHSCHPEN